jgi:hypothetical protein
LKRSWWIGWVKFEIEAVRFLDCKSGGRATLRQAQSRSQFKNILVTSTG